MRYLILFFLSLILGSAGIAQSTLEKAEEYFENRHASIKNNKAASSNIDKAINLFLESDQEPERTIGLLKSYEFKASWTQVNKEEKKSLYKKAIDLATKKMIEFPENGAIAYWHAANYARWADLIDITEAAQKGVVDEIRKLAEKAIELDEKYNQAGALRLLGGIHLEVPSIPLILEWPSNEEAKRLLERANQIAPEHPANVYLYAKMLHKINDEKKAINTFEELIRREEREHYYLVDKKYIGKAKEYYQDNF